MLRVLGLACVAALPLWAQFSGRVSGRVLDASGGAVPAATVELYVAGGVKPLLSVRSAGDGRFHFIAVRPADYDLAAEAPAFVRTTIRRIVVDAARETTVADIRLQLPAVSVTVDVAADALSVETSNAEISGTVTATAIAGLPLLGRDPLDVLQTQPGVVYNGNSLTVINGLRTSYSTVTLDGVNIQDNYLRDSGLDYTPNKLLQGQVRQMTLVSSNGNSASFGGATETAFSTPSGTNLLHGDVFWQNRNSLFSANNWFSNQSGVERPFLNQNQVGFSLGGPVRTDKLFFFANYEAVRARQQLPVEARILTDTARRGIFTYIVSGAPRQADLLALRNIGIDPVIKAMLTRVPGPETINTNTVGDGRNTAGYRFNARNNETRDNITGKIDYNASVRHVLSGSYLWNRQNADRPDLSNGYSTVPNVFNPAHAHLLATSWRWTPSANLTSELRAGFNLTRSYFIGPETYGLFELRDTLFTNPVNEFRNQGRDTDTYVVSDDAAWLSGRHYFQFGFRAQKVNVRTYDEAGATPAYSLGLDSNPLQLTAGHLPGASPTQLEVANSLLATLGGFVDSSSQTFNITSRTSGYVPGAPYLRHLRTGDYSLYIQDKWQLARRFTLTLGVKWEIPGIADERDSLELLPVHTGAVWDTVLSDATLEWAGASAGRPWYNRPWKNFSPNAGFAWDLSGNGKTALRGGYSISRVNDQELGAPENMLLANPAIQGLSTSVGLRDRVGSGLTPVPVPVFRLPIRVSGEYASNPFNTVATIDPNLNRPYVQQYSLGIQHDFRGTLLEARYVGNHVVGAYRAFDYNQVEIVNNGFLADFRRAQTNGYLAQARTGAFDPAFNKDIPGSQSLAVFPQLVRGGDLRSADVLRYLQKGEAGELANYYQVNRLNGSVGFYQNPWALGADVLANVSHSTYNSLQLVARRRTHSGLSLEANYTFSKVLSDADGDLETRFQSFLDINNPALERGRANFDLNHVVKANGVYALPFGNGRRFAWKPIDAIIGGWTVGSVVLWQSGSPFSILSGRGTFNRTVRSYYNTATTPLTMAELNHVVKFRMTGEGPMMVAQSAVNRHNGKGTNADGEAPYEGQVFFHPTAGSLGTLQRRQFSGPWAFNVDVSLARQISLTDRRSIELRGDAFNVLNHATFWSGDQNINDNSFGVIRSTFFPARVMQFGLFYRF